jgi:hypothetical protein
VASSGIGKRPREGDARGRQEACRGSARKRQLPSNRAGRETLAVDGSSRTTLSGAWRPSSVLTREQRRGRRRRFDAGAAWPGFWPAGLTHHQTHRPMRRPRTSRAQAAEAWQSLRSAGRIADRRRQFWLVHAVLARKTPSPPAYGDRLARDGHFEVGVRAPMPARGARRETAR